MSIDTGEALMKDHKKELTAALVVWGIALALLGYFALQTTLPLGSRVLMLTILGAFFGMYILPGARPVLERIRKAQDRWGRIFALLPLLLVGAYCLYGKAYGIFKPQAAYGFALYIIVPTILGILLWKRQGELTFGDLLIILCIWYPIEFSLLPRVNIPPTGKLRAPFHFFMALLPAMFLFLVVRKNDMVGYRYTGSLKDLGWVLISILAICATVLPLGLYIGFIRYNPQNPGAIKIIALFIGIFFLNALPEEFLFRGLLHNLIDKWCGKPQVIIVPLLISSIIFGLTHWNNGRPQPNWNYILLAAIAGFFYGLTYIRTKSIVMSALVHSTVNTIWGVLFK